MPGPLDYESELRGAVVDDRLTVPAEWEGFPGAAFGGFLAGAVLVAAAERTSQPRPLSLFSRYYRPAPLGRPLTFELAPEREGRSVATFHARLSDGEHLLATFSLAFGRDGEAPLEGQAVPPPAPIERPRPVWEHLVAQGLEPGPLMRRIGFRGPTDGDPEPDPALGWHLRSEWPAAATGGPAVRAAVAVMAIDSPVGAATMSANRQDLDGEWPVMMPSLDLNAWFYAAEAAEGEWLHVRTSVPVTQAGYAVGRSQVWAGQRFVAEGMSQVALVPAPPRGDP